MWKLFYWGFLALVTAGFVFVYLNRLEIPLTRSFEDTLDAQIVAMEERRVELARAVVQFEAELAAERALHEKSASGTYSSNPIYALKGEWYKWQIMFIGALQLLFTYRVIFYFIALGIILLIARRIFWRLNP